MARNLLQRMQRGGQLQPSGVYSHRPIVLEEAPEVWETAADALATITDPEQIRADRELDMQEEQYDRNYEIAKDT